MSLKKILKIKSFNVFIILMFFISSYQQTLFAITTELEFGNNQFLAMTSQMNGNLKNVFENINEISRRYKVKTFRILEDNMTIEYELVGGRRIKQRFEKVDVVYRKVDDMTEFIDEMHWIFESGRELLYTDDMKQVGVADYDRKRQLAQGHGEQLEDLVYVESMFWLFEGYLRGTLTESGIRRWEGERDAFYNKFGKISYLLTGNDQLEKYKQLIKTATEEVERIKKNDNELRNIFRLIPLQFESGEDCGDLFQRMNDLIPHTSFSLDNAKAFDGAAKAILMYAMDLLNLEVAAERYCFVGEISARNGVIEYGMANALNMFEYACNIYRSFLKREDVKSDVKKQREYKTKLIAALQRRIDLYELKPEEKMVSMKKTRHEMANDLRAEIRTLQESAAPSMLHRGSIRKILENIFTGLRALIGQYFDTEQRTVESAANYVERVLTLPVILARSLVDILDVVAGNVPYTPLNQKEGTILTTIVEEMGKALGRSYKFKVMNVPNQTLHTYIGLLVDDASSTIYIARWFLDMLSQSLRLKIRI